MKLTFDPDSFVDGPRHPILSPALIRIPSKRLGLKIARQEVLCPLGDPDDITFFTPSLGGFGFGDVVWRSEGGEFGDERGVRGRMVRGESAREKVSVLVEEWRGGRVER